MSISKTRFKRCAQVSGAVGRSLQSLHLLAELPAMLRPGANNFPLGIPDVEALVALGRHLEAMSVLRQHVESNWRVNWRWATEANPAHDVLRQDPEYSRILATIRQDMDAQVADEDF